MKPGTMVRGTNMNMGMRWPPPGRARRQSAAAGLVALLQVADIGLTHPSTVWGYTGRWAMNTRPERRARSSSKHCTATALWLGCRPALAAARPSREPVRRCRSCGSAAGGCHSPLAPSRSAAAACMQGQWRISVHHFNGVNTDTKRRKRQASVQNICGGLCMH